MSLTPKERQELDLKMKRSEERRNALWNALERLENTAYALNGLGIGAHKLGLGPLGKQMIGFYEDILEEIEVVRKTFSEISDERVKEAQQSSLNVFNAAMAGIELQRRRQEREK